MTGKRLGYGINWHKNFYKSLRPMGEESSERIKA